LVNASLNSLNEITVGATVEDTLVKREEVSAIVLEIIDIFCRGLLFNLQKELDKGQGLLSTPVKVCYDGFSNVHGLSKQALIINERLTRLVASNHRGRRVRNRSPQHAMLFPSVS
jgi:hypothetical protein